MRMGHEIADRGLHPHRLILFGRYPVPGQTKTRLIPALGPVGAAELHRELFEHTLATCELFCAPSGTPMEIHYDGATKGHLVRWLGNSRACVPQTSGDLGQRMFHSFVDAFAQGSRRVVLLGTDIPGLGETHLAEAFQALADHDVVLGPSTDGGYWLIGLAKPAPVFSPVHWGTREVLSQTIELAKRQGLRVYRLPPLSDIDTPEDIIHLKPSLKCRPYLSVIIPTLNEADTIGSTLRTARSQDAEILVVDGGSSDDTVQRAMESGATVVSSAPGRARQQNCGAASAEGRVLLFLHADTHLPSDYAAQIFETLMDPKTAAGAFRFKTDLDHPLMKLIEAVTHLRSRFLQLPYGDQGLFLRKRLFEKLKGFPEVDIAEEIFFLRKVSKHGRIRTLRTEAVTSARRWRRLGLLRTTLINQLILLGCGLGISPERLASLYRIPKSVQKMAYTHITH